LSQTLPLMGAARRSSWAKRLKPPKHWWFALFGNTAGTKHLIKVSVLCTRCIIL